MDEGVVEFSIGVAELMVFDEKLEPFCESGFGTVIFGEGRHELGVFDDESWVEALGFQESTY